MKLFFTSLIFLIFLFLAHKANGQYDNVWVFGNNAGINFNMGGNPAGIVTRIDGWGEACASICNDKGELLFYTEGNTVWDRNHNIMPNAASIVPINPCRSGGINATTSSAAQGTLIIPYPGNPSQYYVFSLTAFECENNMGMLFYSIVDISLNNGLGDVVASQKGILIDTGFSEKITSMAGGRCNVWIVSQTRKGLIYAYEIKSDGTISAPVISKLYSRDVTMVIGVMTPSSDGAKIAITSLDILGADPGACIVDFDIASGVAQLGIALSAKNAYGTCFSPDGSKLYVNFEENSNGAGFIAQYDLSMPTADAIVSSEVKIADLIRLTQLKIGPDRKIYFSGTSFLTSNMGTIAEPNVKGPACRFNPIGLTLAPGSGVMLGLPNNISVIRGSDDTLYTNHYDTNACFKNTFSLSIDNVAYQIEWDDGSDGAERKISHPGTYWVKYKIPSELCLHRVDSFHVVFRGTLPIVFSEASCRKNNNGSAWYQHTYMNWDSLSNYKYAWRNLYPDTIISTSDTITDLMPGVYALHITNVFGCDTTIQVIINQENDSVSFHIDSIACEGFELKFENNSSHHYNTFEWDLGDGNYSVQNNPTHYYNSGKYRIIMTGSGPKCRDTVSALIEVDAPVEVSFVIRDREVCSGEEIVVFPSLYNDSTLTAFQWNVGHYQYLDYGVDSAYTFNYDYPGNIPIILSARFRVCPASTFVDTFVVQALPKVDLGRDTSICFIGTPLLLSNKYVPDEEKYQNLWSTGDTSSYIKVVHPGRYSLTVTTDALGCNTTESIIIHKDCYIDLPNSFTPNGDGRNDYFFPRQMLSKGVSRFTFQIFSRWGQILFETTSTDGHGWDGKFNGKDQPMGVYVYYLHVVFENGFSEQYEGNVTLIR